VGDLIKDKDSLLGKEVSLCGWVDRVRDHGKLRFIILRDRTGQIQLVVKQGETPEEAVKASNEARDEAVICVKGTLRKAPTKEGVEVAVREMSVLNRPVEPLPLLPRDSLSAVLDTRLKFRWLDVRNPKVTQIFLLQAWVAQKFREYFSSKGFVEIFTPKIVGAGTEGGAEVFPVIYFGKPAFLAQSPQFYKQFSVIAGLERVFEIGPVFRAEPHHTTRHLTEYHSMDIEVGFIQSYHDVISFVEGFLRHLAEAMRKEELPQRVLQEYNVEPLEIPGEVPKIPIRKAYEILDSEFKKHIPYGEDLDSEGEKLLGQYVKERFKSDLVFVTEYPWKVRPFYTMRKEDEPDWTYSFDGLLRGLEVVTGGQREHRYERLVENVKDKGMNPKNFEFYLNFFKHGAPPHGGAGLGLERITMQSLKLENIREARLLPRDPETLLP